MKVPQYLRDEVKKWPVLIVQKSCLAAEKVVDSLVEEFKVNRRDLHLRTGNHDAESFQNWTQYSVITYGILWEWLTGSQSRTLVLRYGGIFLDEFSDLDPKEEECARILHFFSMHGEAPWMKLVSYKATTG